MTRSLVEITYTPSANYSEPSYVSGCGKAEGYVLHCVRAVGTGGSASSCRSLKFSEAVAQASFSGDCPKEEINTTWLEPNLGVDACGTRMTFTPTLSGWVLNTQGSAPAGGSDDEPSPE